jgi:hypothetical protein
LQDLVFVKYNQTLKERYDSKDVIDPVVLDDDIDGNEWLLGDEVEAPSDLVFDGDDLSWLDVDIASGAAEPTINTRSQANSATTPAPKPPLHPASSSRTKPKRNQIVVNDEFDDQDYVGDGEDDEEDEVHEDEFSGGGSDDEDDTNFNDS